MIKKILIMGSVVAFAGFAEDATLKKDVETTTKAVKEEATKAASEVLNQSSAATDSTTAVDTQKTDESVVKSDSTKKAKKPKYVANSMLVTKADKESYQFIIRDAAVENDKDGIKKNIANRTIERWKLIKAGNYFAAYDYLSPTQKQVIEQKKYSTSFGGALDYTGVKVTRIQCDNETLEKAESCLVRVYVSYTHGSFKIPTGNLLTEKWIKEDGKWWYYQK